MTRLAQLFSLIALAALPALADTGVNFAGLKTDPTAPVQVTADQLQIAQADGTASFSGHVTVTQSDMVLQADRVTVVYAEDGKGIAQLHAEGNVTVKAGSNAAAADDALYTVATADLLLSGHVLLTEGQATLAGDRLSINLQTGLGSMTGNVTTTFAPASGGAASQGGN